MRRRWFLRAQIGVVAAPGAAGVGKTRMRFSSSIKAAVSAKLALAGRLSTQSRSPPSPARRTIRRPRPVTSATISVPKRCNIWSRAPCTGGKDAKCSIIRSRRSSASREMTGLPSASQAGREMKVPFLVGVELEQLGRERVLQVIEHVFARRDVDREIGPFRGRNFGEPAVEQAPRWSRRSARLRHGPRRDRAARRRSGSGISSLLRGD